MKRLTLLLVAPALLFAEYRFDPVILDAIKHCECDVVDGKCHPYTIRLNRKPDVQTALELGYDVTRSVIRFKDAKEATAAAKHLIESGCANIDLGAYQINYHYHPSENVSVYFDEKESRRFAEKILHDLTERHGYSWQTLGRYHSGTSRLNRKYYLRLHKYIYGYDPRDKPRKDD